MRASALRLLFVLGTTAMTTTMMAAPAWAQVKVQDITDTFADGRAAHQSRMEGRPQQWWNGQVYDGATRHQPQRSTTSAPLSYRDVPANPATVQPLFSFEEMMNAAQNNPAGNIPRAPDKIDEQPVSLNPTDIENMGKKLLSNATSLISREKTPSRAVPNDDNALVDTIAPKAAPALEEAAATAEAPALEETAKAEIPVKPEPVSPLPAPRDPPVYNISAPPVQDEGAALPVDPNGAEETLAPDNARPIP